MGGSKEDYLVDKKCAKRAVYNAKKIVQEIWFTEINTDKDWNKFFKLAKKMKVDNNDVIDDKCVKDKNNNLVLGDKTKLHVLKADYEKLLNMEFDWDNNSLSIEPSVKDFAIKITKDMAAEAVQKLKEGKAYGQSEIVIEMVKAGGDTILDVITDMINLIIKEEQFLKTTTTQQK